MKLNFYNGAIKQSNPGICYKIGAGLLVSLLLILLFGCQQSSYLLFDKYSPADMLPILNNFGFLIQNSVEMDKKDMLGLSQNIAGQFDILASQNDLKAVIFPLKMAKRMYFREDTKLIITISLFEDKKTAVKELQNERTKLKEVEDTLRKSASMKVFPGKEIVVNGNQGYRSSYNNIFLQNISSHSNILIWSKGLCVFKVESIGKKFLAEEEALQIAGKIKY